MCKECLYIVYLHTMPVPAGPCRIHANPPGGAVFISTLLLANHWCPKF